MSHPLTYPKTMSTNIRPEIQKLLHDIEESAVIIMGEKRTDELTGLNLLLISLLDEVNLLHQPQGIAPAKDSWHAPYIPATAPPQVVDQPKGSFLPSRSLSAIKQKMAQKRAQRGMSSHGL